MKYINLHNPPRSLTEWKNRETLPYQRHYDGSLPTNVKDDIRNNRVQDQGGLCAYTLREITRFADNSWDAHVEHVIPRAQSKSSENLEQTVDYYNLVACANKTASLPYGASVRGDRTLPISPSHPTCESRFRFSITGKILPSKQNDSDASTTIDVLNLNHGWLAEMRRVAMAARGLAIRRADAPHARQLRPQRHLSAQAAQSLAREIMEPNGAGKLSAFCVAISHAAVEHAERMEKVARQRKHSRVGDQ